MREEDLELLITLDDPWNAQECDTFYSHQAEPAVAYRLATAGRHDHRAGAVIFNHSYMVTPNTSAEKEHHRVRSAAF